MTRVDVDQGRGATGLTFCRPESQGHEMFGNINTDHLHPGGFNVCAKCDLHISGEIDFTKVYTVTNQYYVSYHINFCFYNSSIMIIYLCLHVRVRDRV